MQAQPTQSDLLAKIERKYQDDLARAKATHDAVMTVITQTPPDALAYLVSLLTQEQSTSPPPAGSPPMLLKPAEQPTVKPHSTEEPSEVGQAVPDGMSRCVSNHVNHARQAQPDLVRLRVYRIEEVQVLFRS